MSDDECVEDHVWRLLNGDNCVWRKCAYCTRREILVGEWEKIEDAD